MLRNAGDASINKPLVVVFACVRVFVFVSASVYVYVFVVVVVVVVVVVFVVVVVVMKQHVVFCLAEWLVCPRTAETSIEMTTIV